MKALLRNYDKERKRRQNRPAGRFAAFGTVLSGFAHKPSRRGIPFDVRVAFAPTLPTGTQTGTGGGTQTGAAWNDVLPGYEGLPAATGRKMHFTGKTVLKVIDGLIVEENGLDDGLTAMMQLGLIKKA